MSKCDLLIDPPLMNAAGVLGFSPALHGPLDLGSLGAFVTNPVSLEPRAPARQPRCLPYPGGFLLHTGHPNPGFNAVLRGHAPRWQRAALPVIVHLLAESVEGTAWMARRLEGVEGVAGIELGLPPDVDPAEACALARAAASGELPVIVRLPLERSAGLLPALAGLPGGEGPAAASLGAPRGVLPLPGGGAASGRLYGPALLPLVLAAVHATRQDGLPVIAGGGVYSRAEADLLLKAGAAAVQLDAVLWREGVKA